MENFDNEEEFYETVIITDEDGTSTEFAIISSLKNGDATYLLAMESELLEDDEAEAVILKECFTDEGKEEIVYTEIENDDEFEKIVTLFQQSENEDYEIEI